MPSPSEKLQNVISDTDSKIHLSERKSVQIEIDPQMMIQELHFRLPELDAVLASQNIQHLEDELVTAVEKALAKLFNQLSKHPDAKEVTLKEYAQFVARHYQNIDRWRLYDEVHYEDFDKLWEKFQSLRKKDKKYSVFSFIDEYVTDAHREKRRRAGG